MKMLVTAIAALIVVSAIYVVWQPFFDWPGFRATIQEHLMAGSWQMTITPFGMAGLIILATANFLLIFRGLATVWRLFDGFEKGNVFTAESGMLLWRSGQFALAGAISMILSRTVAILLVTYANPPGQGILAVSFGTTEAMLLLVCGLLLVMGQVMMIATEIEAENRSII